MLSSIIPSFSHLPNLSSIPKKARSLAPSYLQLALGAGIIASLGIFFATRRAGRTEEAQKKLEEGMEVSAEARKKIQELMPKIRKGQTDPEIVWYGRGNTLVFSLKSVPNQIFKMKQRSILGQGKVLSPNEQIEMRFANMVKAQEVCLAHNLDLLVVPHAMKFDVQFEGEAVTLIAEELFDISQAETEQERLYQELSGLEETIRQLVVFIAKTGFNDVDWRNIPLLDVAGQKRVVLVDPEDMNSAADGLFGKDECKRRGLIRCLHSEAHIDLALDEARKQGFAIPAGLKARRLADIKSDRDLRQFHTKNGVFTNPKKPIQIDDLTSLGLNLDEEAYLPQGSGTNSPREKITLKDALLDIVEEINREIANSSEEASTKGKRSIELNTASYRTNLRHYTWLGAPEDKSILSAEEAKQIWLRRVLEALVKAGHLFQFSLVDSYGYKRGYFIQA